MIIGVLTKPPRFLTEAEVLSLHEGAIQRYGGSTGVRDTGLLASALAMPQQGFGGEFAHLVPFGMAAAYTFHLCKNHPFVDGNKRAAFLACVTFLFLNGWHLTSPDEVTADKVLAIAESRMSKDEFALWLSEHARPRPSLELRDYFAHIDLVKLHDHLQAVVASGSLTEMSASAQEASLSIPAANSLLLAAGELRASGQEEAANRLSHQAALLIALYRIAEEMGYEW